MSATLRPPMDVTRANAVLHSLPDCPETEPPRSIAITTLDQFRGNRLVHHFYPEHWAKVQLARHIAQQYGGLTTT